MVVSIDPSRSTLCAVTFTLVGVAPGVPYQVRVSESTGFYIVRILSLPAQGTASAQLKLEESLTDGVARVLGGGPSIPVELPADPKCV